MDNTFLQAVVDSVRPRLTGASIARVWQPTANTLALDTRLGDGRVLLISVRPDAPALFLADRTSTELDPNAGGDLAFGALIRKYLRGARIEALRKPAGDRVVTLEVRGFAASGEIARFELVAELTGRSANVLLVDGDGRVLAVLREAVSGLARIGGLYGAPPAGAPAWSRMLERELATRATPDGEDAARTAIAAELAAPHESFLLYREPSGRHTLSTIALRSLAEAAVHRFTDPSEAAEAWWRDRDDTERIATRSREVAQRIRTTRDREVRALEAMDDDLRSAEGASRLREIAESLLAQQSSAKPVDGGYSIVDLYSEDQHSITVEADRGVTPQALAERYFARHRRMRRTREAIVLRRPIVEARIAALDALAAELALVESPQHIDEVRERLDTLLGIRRTPARAAVRGGDGARPVKGARRFVSSDGYEILVGRTSAANDELTFKVARPSDIWLHAADYPGSHVVVRLFKRGEVPHRTLLEAAQLAAHFSQAKDEAMVDVRYTERKFVGKPKGAGPGLVRLQRFKSITVRPSSDLARGGDS